MQRSHSDCVCQTFLHCVKSAVPRWLCQSALAGDWIDLPGAPAPPHIPPALLPFLPKQPPAHPIHHRYIQLRNSNAPVQAYVMSVNIAPRPRTHPCMQLHLPRLYVVAPRGRGDQEP